MSDQLTVLIVFIGVFAGIISEKLDKTLIVLAAALFLILTGYIEFKEAMHSIDYDTICLLMGMMLLVEGIREIHIFDWISIRLGLLTRGNPVLIFFMFGIATAVFSAFLDNVTTVLIIIPLIITLTRAIGLESKIFVLCLIFLSNIGGASTLIGDPPNILIGTQVKELTFISFIQYLTVPVVISAIVTFIYLGRTNKDVIKSRNKNFSWLFLSNLMLEDMKRKRDELKIPRSVMVRTIIVFGLVLFGFFTHPITHIEAATIALAGAALMLIVFHKSLDLHKVIAHIEWPTLLFFGGLFIIVGTMEHVGLLELISHELTSLTSNLLILLMIVIWASAILSALVDNIPFVAVMIPVLKDLMKQEPYASNPKSYLLWWALALGACFGGNGSMIGASANVVSCAIAKGRGVDIGFKEFAKFSIPVTFMSIVISSLYIAALYYY